jgi:hypothetical protein
VSKATEGTNGEHEHSVEYLVDDDQSFDARGPFHFVLEEICVTVATPGRIDACSPEAAGQRRTVAQLLNRCLPAFLPTQPSHEQDAKRVEEAIRRTEIPDSISREEQLLLKDIYPSIDRWQQFRISDRGLFRPIVRWGPHSIFLSHCDYTTAHHYFRVGLEWSMERSSTLEEIDKQRFELDQERSAIIWELVSIINHNFGRLPSGTDPDGKWQIIAATPHWLTSAAGGLGDHGPGTPPGPPDEEPCPPSPGRFKFADAQHVGQPYHALQELVERQRRATQRCARSGVIVAVLDQSPSLEQFEHACNTFRENRLLQSLRDIRNPLHIDGALSLSAADFAHLNLLLPNLRGHDKRWIETLKEPDPVLRAQNLRNLRNEFYPSADHGIFVAGIIRDIAPGAEIHLIRVLDDVGMGDLLAITDVLAALPSWLHREQQDRPLVVNLSLTLDIPTRKEMIETLFPELSKLEGMRDKLVDKQRHHEVPRRIAETVEKVLADIQQSVTDVIAYLYEQNIVVVAAAGNGGTGEDQRPETALPARCETVISVASVDLNMQPSYFSNRGEEKGCNNGVATFSGDAIVGETPAAVVLEPAGNSRSVAGEIELQADPHTDGTQGVFTARKLPSISSPPDSGNAQPDNKVGWVYWAGTSFSTPIISAIAANLLAEMPTMTVDDIIKAVRAFAVPNDHLKSLGVNAIFAKQE